MSMVECRHNIRLSVHRSFFCGALWDRMRAVENMHYGFEHYLKRLSPQIVHYYMGLRVWLRWKSGCSAFNVLHSVSNRARGKRSSLDVRYSRYIVWPIFRSRGWQRTALKDMIVHVFITSGQTPKRKLKYLWEQGGLTPTLIKHTRAS